jgi:hypothetical protein
LPENEVADRVFQPRLTIRGNENERRVGSPTKSDELLATKKKTPRALSKACGRVQVFTLSVKRILSKHKLSRKSFFYKAKV